MNVEFFELSNNRWVGLSLFEITSLPDVSLNKENTEDLYEQNVRAFRHIIDETHALMHNNLCIELFWVTQKVERQPFSSIIRFFFVLRKMGENKNNIEHELIDLKTALKNNLVSMHYSISDIQDNWEQLMNLMDDIDQSFLYATVKNQRTIGNAYSPYPYYYSDIVPGKNTSNFSEIVATLSQVENCAISFQLFPTVFKREEIGLINEVAGELSRFSGGMYINRDYYRDSFASEPLKAYMYYSEHRNSPIFSYNILTIGSKANCASLSTKISSLIQDGTTKVVKCDPVCIDLSGEHIQLKKHFSIYPWNVNVRLMHYYRNTELQKKLPLARKMFRLPFIMTAEEAVSFFRLPIYEKSMVAVKPTKNYYDQEQLSSAVVNDSNIVFGKLFTNDDSNIMVGCSKKALTKHALIVGTPGSGKTTFSMNLLLQLANRGIPFLAVEPTKAEYRDLISVIPNLQVFTPGNHSVCPYVVNPFIPPKGISVEQYIPSLASAFKAAFSMPGPLELIFQKAIRNCYTRYGWKDFSKIGDSDVRFFGLYEFILEYKRIMKNMNYGKEVKGNLEAAGLLRLENLIEQNSNIYDSINTVPIEDLISKPTVIELNSIDNSEQKALIMALLLISVCVYTKHNHRGDGELKNALLIDEAHVLFSNTQRTSDDKANSQESTVKALQDMIAEIRAYGTAIIIADQSPSKVSRDIVANTDIKVAFRLVQAVEKDLIADSTNMDMIAKTNLSKLLQGQAYFYYSQLETPQLILTEDVRKTKKIALNISDEKLAGKCRYWSDHLELSKPYFECKYCSCGNGGCITEMRSYANFISQKALDRFKDQICDDKLLRRCIYNLPILFADDFHKFSGSDKECAVICSRIQLIRKAKLELSVELADEDAITAITKFPNEAKE